MTIDQFLHKNEDAAFEYVSFEEEDSLAGSSREELLQPVFEHTSS